MIQLPAIWILYAFMALGAVLLVLAIAYLLVGLRHGSHMGLTVLSSGIFVFGLGVIVWMSVTTAQSISWTNNVTIPLPSMNFINFGS